MNAAHASQPHSAVANDQGAHNTLSELGRVGDDLVHGMANLLVTVVHLMHTEIDQGINHMQGWLNNQNTRSSQPAAQQNAHK